MQDIIDNFFNFDILIRSRVLLLGGLFMTLRLISFSVLLASGFGLVLAVFRHARIRFFDPIIILYINLVRAIPGIVMLMLIFYVLPFTGIRMSPFWALTSAVAFTGGAYYAEIFRGGLSAVPRGQTEAARASGLTFIQTTRYVILPQAMRIILPPLTTNTVELIKATSIAAVVALPDLLWQALQAQATTMNSTPLTAALILYLIILLPLVELIRYLEGRMKTDY